VSKKNIQHLYWKAGFGPTPELLARSSQNVRAEADRIFSLSEKPVTLDAVTFKSSTSRERASMTAKENKMRKKMSRIGMRQLNKAWFDSMISNPDLLGERMALFWAGIFACQSLSPAKAQNYVNVIRKNALGNFRDLLFGISKHAAMLRYLNNQSNRKRNPNENFAREVMELFTLGIGNYSETDVREAARSFTGWAHDEQNNFVFNNHWHDSGTKTFLGEKGYFKGDDILNIILKQKQCARYIVSRIYRYFVNDQPDKQRIESLAESFYSSGYDIRKLMYRIFTSDWFYDPENIGVKIKPPVVFLVNISKNFDVNYLPGKTLLDIQKILGQALLFPPNVGGWPDGQSMIDSSTLMFRMKLPQILLEGAQSIFESKEEYDAQLAMQEDDQEDMMEKMESLKQFRQILAKANWDKMIAYFSSITDPSDRLKELPEYFLQTGVANKIQSDLRSLNIAAAEDQIKKCILLLMSLPEYQLC